MKLLYEMVSDSILNELAAEMDVVLAEYEALFGHLTEGVLDNLSDDLNDKLNELKKRLAAVAKARNIVTGLQQGGEFSKEQAADHRKRITSNKKALSASLQRTRAAMVKLHTKAKQAIESHTDIDAEEDSQHSRKLAPMILKKAYQEKLDRRFMFGERYGDAFRLLVNKGYMSEDGKITQKGKELVDKNTGN